MPLYMPPTDGTDSFYLLLSASKWFEWKGIQRHNPFRSITKQSKSIASIALLAMQYMM